MVTPSEKTKHSFDYTSKSHMTDLGLHVWSLTSKQFNVIAPAILAGDIMRTHWWIRLCVWAMMKRRKIGKVEAYRQLQAEIMRRGKIDLFDQLQLATALHISKGKDRYDKRSAGGLCAREVDLVVDLILVASNTPR